MSNEVNCFHCVHWHEYQHRCTLNDNSEIKKECYFRNRHSRCDKRQRIIDDLQKENQILYKALELSCEFLCGMSIWKENEYENAIKDSVEYFKDRAKEIVNDN